MASGTMRAIHDGPSSPLFWPLGYQAAGGAASALIAPGELAQVGLSEQLSAAAQHAPGGACTCWGIPFRIDRLAVLRDTPIELVFDPALTAASRPDAAQPRWLVFMHTADLKPLPPGAGVGPDASASSAPHHPMRGQGHLGQPAAAYVLLYADGAEERVVLRRRFEIGAFQRIWGENCFTAVAHQKPLPVRAHHEQPAASWGRSQTRAEILDGGPWVNWLYAWEDPRPEVPIVGVRL